MMGTQASWHGWGVGRICCPRRSPRERRQGPQATGNPLETLWRPVHCWPAAPRPPALLSVSRRGSVMGGGHHPTLSRLSPRLQHQGDARRPPSPAGAGTPIQVQGRRAWSLLLPWAQLPGLPELQEARKGPWASGARGHLSQPQWTQPRKVCLPSLNVEQLWRAAPTCPLFPV